jgi:alanine dehydrogenase
MHHEAGERRDFLPALVHGVAELGCRVFVGSGIGSGMGFDDDAYRRHPRVSVVDDARAYAQNVVVVLRAPERELARLRRGSVLVSMLHFHTRPARVRDLRARGIDALSLDAIVDDEGRRLVVNGRAVAWNGLEAAFEMLERTWPSLVSRTRRPVHVTILGSGEIGRFAVDAAIKYGNPARAELLSRCGVPGVEAVAIGRNLTGNERYLKRRLLATDILVDATRRHDPSVPVIRGDWLRRLPPHAVICDLAVDPYLLDAEPPTVRGIEGIPQGSLDQYTFDVEDPAWDLLPAPHAIERRRAVVSCYSWPGVHPAPCMEHYGTQLLPLLETLVARGGLSGVRADGTFYERALFRGSLRALRQGGREPLRELPRRRAG